MASSKSIKANTVTQSLPQAIPKATAQIRHARNGSDPGHRFSRSTDDNRKKLAALVAKHAADEQLQIRINNIQNTTALAAMRFNTPPQGIGEHDPGIVDGYLEDVIIIKMFINVNYTKYYICFYYTITESRST